MVSKMIATESVEENTNDEYFANNSINNSINSKEFNKWNRFSEWLHCICVVTFDLELGQAMEVFFVL